MLGKKQFLFILACVMPVASHGATLVKFGAKLCAPGYHLSNGECAEIVRDVCPAGYYRTLIQQDVFRALGMNVACQSTYTRRPLPDAFFAIYNGVLFKFGPALCASGENWTPDGCQPHQQSVCPDNFYRTRFNASTFWAQSVSTANCRTSYALYELPEFINIIYNGTLVSFGAPLCSSGQYLSDGVCTARTRGDCPEKFYDLDLGSDTTIKPAPMGKCETGYGVYSPMRDCGAYGDALMCATLCSGDDVYTGVGTCAALCDGPFKQMRVSTGLSIPLYSAVQATPSLNVMMLDGTICYGNAMPGTASGTLNISNGEQTWHLTD